MSGRSRLILLIALVAAGAAGPFVVQAWRSVADPWELLGSTPVVRATTVLRPVGTSKLHVDETRYSFGTMDVDQTAEHTFLIQNVGDGDLNLRLGATSCKCARGELSNETVPPGGEARLRLVWQPYKPAELFAQGATIHTNDPARPSIYLHVVGEVRTHLAASQESLVLKASLGESATRCVLIYSQAWDAFEIEATCDRPELKIEVQPATAAALEEVEAVAGCQVQVTLPSDLPRGTFNATLRVKSAGLSRQATTRQLELPIHGVVASRVSVQGPGLEEGNRLDLGTIWHGDASRRTLAIFVRGSHEDLAVRDIRCRPAFLKVSVGSREQVSQQLSRYQVQVEVPANASITHSVGASTGEIVLATNHPDAPELRWSVDFAVLEKP